MTFNVYILKPPEPRRHRPERKRDVVSGHYTSHYLAEILRDLFFEESTGVIKIQDPSGGEVSLHFDRGIRLAE